MSLFNKSQINIQPILNDVDEGFTNKFKLLDSHKESWNFGPLSDGNITKIENIQMQKK